MCVRERVNERERERESERERERERENERCSTDGQGDDSGPVFLRRVVGYIA